MGWGLLCDKSGTAGELSVTAELGSGLSNDCSSVALECLSFSISLGCLACTLLGVFPAYPDFSRAVSELILPCDTHQVSINPPCSHSLQSGFSRSQTELDPNTVSIPVTMTIQCQLPPPGLLSVKCFARAVTQLLPFLFPVCFAGEEHK